LPEVIQLGLSADATRRRGAEFSRGDLDGGASISVFQRHVYPIAGEIRDPNGLTGLGCAWFKLECRDLSRARDDPFGPQKAGGELIVVAWCPHGDDQRLSIDADLERLLNGDQIVFKTSSASSHAY
jgi:hypothetical protein